MTEIEAVSAVIGLFWSIREWCVWTAAFDAGAGWGYYRALGGLHAGLGARLDQIEAETGYVDRRPS